MVTASRVQLPLHFEANEGQVDRRVKFLSRGGGYVMHLTPAETVLSLQSSVVRMRFPGARPNPEVSGLEPLPGRSNYLTGNDPEQWHTDVPHYSRVRYSDLYPGIDLIFYGNQNQLEYDFVVGPGSDPGMIRLEFEGADALTLDEAGNLIVTLPQRTDEVEVPGDELILRAPVIYQEVGNSRRGVDGAFKAQGDTQVSFHIGDYDSSLPLIIDPVLIYSTHLGGSTEESAGGVVVDRDGNAYVSGTAKSADFPTKAALDPVLGGSRDAFVAKLNPSGSALVFSTFLGGSGSDYGGSIALDRAGNIYLSGRTYSTDFPTLNAVDPVNAGSFPLDLFITKLNPTASAIVFSTYLGGDNGDEYGGAIAVDGSGNAYVTGKTESTDFPTANAWQPVHSEGSFPTYPDAIVAKLPPSGKPLAYSTFLGGAGAESAYGIAVDAAGNAYVTGVTESSDFPTLNALKPVFSTTAWTSDAFVAKLNTSGTVVYSTYFGGDDNSEVGHGIAVDLVGNTYITGSTSSTDFPTKNACQGTYQGNIDAYVAQLKPDGSAIIQATYLGGSEAYDTGYGIAVDRFGGSYITGRTDSSDFPTVHPLQGERGWDSDAFFARLSPDGSQLMYSTHLGGSNGLERGFAITVGENRNIYVVGITWSSDFPTFRAMQPTNQGASNAWVMNWQLPANFWLAAAEVPDDQQAGEDDGGEH